MLGGISIWQLLIIMVIVALLFGTKKLGSIGSDLGSAIKGFKRAVKDGEDEVSSLTKDKADTVSQKVSDKDHQA